ncbi:MAG TPA: hypothetical protein VH816_16815 [Gaiellaceae bacterium]|jgi:hypothetical protein
MSPRTPDFFDLVGDEGTPEELERLRRAHDLLLAAGPPPELSPRLAEAPGARSSARSAWGPRRRKGAAFLLAGAVAAAAFGIGYLTADRGSSGFSAKGSPIEMHPPSGSSPTSAKASVLIGDRDEVGNWPLLVRVSGLAPLPAGQWYELYLTRNGKITAWCGAFNVKDRGRTSVHFSVPYKLKGFDGWVVTSSKRQPKPQVLLTT